MASTVLPNGIIIPEKYSRDWYADLYHNWQELDNLLGGGGGGANDGTLTIQKNGTTVGTFSANQATDATANIEVPTKTSDLTNDSGFITSDDTKIPLAGSNQISGDLIPATDNSIDIGSSTSNIKMLYTKGITIDGKTIDTDANGNMTYDGHIVDAIEEQGNGYIRYSSGLQICYGSATNNNNLGTGITRVSFPKAFNAGPNLTATPTNPAGYLCTASAEGTSTWRLHTFAYHNNTIEHVGDAMSSNFIAVGTWK